MIVDGAVGFDSIALLEAPDRSRRVRPLDAVDGTWIKASAFKQQLHVAQAVTIEAGYSIYVELFDRDVCANPLLACCNRSNG